MRAARSPIERFSPGLLHVYRRCMAVPVRGNRCSARGESCQCLNGVLRLWRTRAIRRRGVVWKDDVVLLGRLHVGD
jgi:hypothetical protein